MARANNNGKNGSIVSVNGSALNVPSVSQDDAIADIAKAEAEAEAMAKAKAEAEAKAKAEAEAKAKAKAEAEAKAKAEAEAKAKAEAEAKAKAKAEAEAKAKAEAEAKAKAEAEIVANFLRTADFIDYIPSKLVGRTLINIKGKKLQHDQPIGIAAIGYVTLTVNGKSTDFGFLSKDGFVLSRDALAIPIKSNDAIEYEDVIGIKAEIEKYWCYAVKLQLLKDKSEKTETKKQQKLAKMKAFSAIL